MCLDQEGSKRSSETDLQILLRSKAYKMNEISFKLKIAVT